MNCETLCDHLLELTDGSIDPALEAECRAHLAGCRSCALEVARHRAAWRLLDELPAVEKTPPARLKQMAATALAAARATPEAPESDLVPGRGGAPSSPGNPRLLRRRVVRVAAAAALVLATALGTEWVLHSKAPAGGAGGGDAPDCLADAEFVGDFEVLRDLPDMDDASDGELLDLDHDEVVMLQLCDTTDDR
jgi:anti-sigma factor RsiW